MDRRRPPYTRARVTLRNNIRQLLLSKLRFIEQIISDDRNETELELVCKMSGGGSDQYAYLPGDNHLVTVTIEKVPDNPYGFYKF